MAEDTEISWADSTANFWAGCQKVSPGCDYCYAEALMSDRFGRVQWGPHGERQKIAQGWRDLRKWQRAADRNGGVDPILGRRRRVFINSLADFFDSHRTVPWRGEAWALFRECPSLDIMLLTKRPQNIPSMLPDDWGEGWPNIWLGTTIENQIEADRRAIILASIPARIRFLSAEPLLGPTLIPPALIDQFHWLIVGGESGQFARPMLPVWANELIDQGLDAGLAVHFKQWGEWQPCAYMGESSSVYAHGEHFTGDRLALIDGQGFIKAGKKRAGHLLYGKEIREFPA